VARFTEVEQIRPAATVGFDASSLVSRLDSFTQQKTRETAQKVATEAKAAGQRALVEGQAPEFKKEGFFGSIPAKAYNEGLRAAYVASIDRDNREEVSKFAALHQNDLSAFNDAVESYRTSTLNNVDPTARDAVAGSLDSLITSNRIRVQNNEIAKNHKENALEVQNQVETATNDALGFARDGDLEAAATSTLAAFAGVDAAVQADFLTETQGAEQKRGIERGITEESKLGDLIRTFDSEGQTAAFEALDEMSRKRPGGFAPQEWDQFVSRAQSKLTQKRSRLAAEKQETSKVALEALKDFEKANSLGFDLNPSEVQRVEQLVQGNPVLEQRFNISNNVRSFSMLSTSDRAAVLSRAETGELANVDEFAAMSVANNEIQKQAQKDGLSLAYNQGILERTPLSLGDSQEFAARVEQSKAASSHYGVPVSPLTDAEAQGLSDKLPEMTTKEKIQLALTFADSPEVWGQLSDKQATTFAMAGATGDVNLMGQVFKGQELIDAKLVTPIKPADYLSDFNDMVEGVYGPKDAQAVLKASIAYYAQTSENKDGTYFKGDFEDAIEAVTGGIAKVNGFKIELPRGVEDDTFEDFIDDIQPETIEKYGGVAGVSNERAAELIKQGRLRNIRSGAYVVDLGNGTLFKPDGTPFIIEWSDDAASLNKALTQSRSRRGR
jgi:hypothetical protein